MVRAMAKLMEVPDSIIYGMDHFKAILKYAKKNIQKNHKNLLESGKI